MRRTLGIAVVTLALVTGACAPPSETPATITVTTLETLPADPQELQQAASGEPSPAATEVTTMSPAPFGLASTAFSEGGAIPKRFTCDGEDASPDLTWSGAPDGTQSLALILTDPDAGGFVHWLVFDLTGTPSGGLPVAVSSSPDAPPQGTNSFGRSGYGGPCPPSGTHHYVFTLAALDGVLELSGAPRIDAIRAAMEGHVLAETTLTGTYQR